MVAVVPQSPYCSGALHRAVADAHSQQQCKPSATCHASAWCLNNAIRWATGPAIATGMHGRPYHTINTACGFLSRGTTQYGSTWQNTSHDTSILILWCHTETVSGCDCQKEVGAGQCCPQTLAGAIGTDCPLAGLRPQLSNGHAACNQSTQHHKCNHNPEAGHRVTQDGAKVCNKWHR